MRIDPQIEPLVRETLDAAVKSDGKRFGPALDAMRDPATMAAALALTSAVVLAILYQQYDGGPNAAELAQVADEVAAHERWAALRPGEYLAVLTSIASGRRDESVEPQSLAVATFVVAAYLLAASTQKPKWWFERLDEIEAAIENG